MKLRYLLITLSVSIGLTAFALQDNNATQQQAQRPTVEQLQQENEEMQQQLNRLEKEVETYRGDVRNKIQELDEDQSRWTAWIIALVTLMTGVVGILAPYIINRQKDKELQT